MYDQWPWPIHHNHNYILNIGIFGGKIAPNTCGTNKHVLCIKALFSATLLCTWHSVTGSSFSTLLDASRHSAIKRLTDVKRVRQVWVVRKNLWGYRQTDQSDHAMHYDCAVRCIQSLIDCSHCTLVYTQILINAQRACARVTVVNPRRACAGGLL